MSGPTKRRHAAATLCIDVGGTGLKAMILDPSAKPLTDRARVETPRPATPDAILGALKTLVASLERGFDRISVGFPGVVFDGVVRTAPNLDAAWAGYPLEDALQRAYGKRARVLNDAGVQGFGIIERRGLEMVLTLGTGMGCALFIDGTYVPNLELAHHPFRHGRTYEEYVGNAALEEVGKKKWNKRVARVIAQVHPIFNPRHLYLGGGNAKHVRLELPENTSIANNVAGILGGVALWRD